MAKYTTQHRKRSDHGAPLYILLQRFVEHYSGNSLKILDEALLPSSLFDHLFDSVFPEDSGGGFFLRDRTRFRINAVYGTGGEKSSHRENQELMNSLDEFFRHAGKDPGKYYILSPDILTLPDHFPRKSDLYCFVIWSAESSFLERILSGNSMATSITAIREHYDSLEKGNTPEVVVEEKKEESGVELADSFVLTGSWEKLGNLRYRKAGRTKGLFYRKSYLIIKEDRIRIAMLSSDEELPEHYILGFFDQILSSVSAPETHRVLLMNSPPPESIHSFSMDIGLDGSLRATSHSIRPVIWRNRTKKLLLFPDSVRKNRVRCIPGRILPGDVMLLLPGTMSSHQIYTLEERFRMGFYGEFASGIDGWLDDTHRGRSLLLTLLDSP